MISDKAVEAALKASVPGGSEVWCWLPQKDAWTPHETAKDVMRCALRDAIPVLLEGKAEEIARVIDPGAWTNADQNGREWAEEHTEILLSIAKANRIIAILTGESDER